MVRGQRAITTGVGRWGTGEDVCRWEDLDGVREVAMGAGGVMSSTRGRMIASPVTAAWCMDKEVLGSRQQCGCLNFMEGG